MLWGLPDRHVVPRAARRVVGPRIGFACLALMAACSPQSAADAVLRQAAGSVVQPIVEGWMQPAQAEGVTRCLLDAAQPDELRALAQDVGTTGGTRPRAGVLTLGSRPAARACIGAAGLPQIPGAL